MGATKRKAPSMGKPPKKQRNSYISSVVDALDGSSLPRSCCEMLTVLADTSLSVPSDERTPIDDKAVELIEVALKTLHTQYINEADEMQQEKEAAKLAFTEAEAAYSTVQAAAAGAEADTSAAKHSLAAVYEDFATKRDALDTLKIEVSKKTEAAALLEAEHELLAVGSTALMALRDESFELVPAPKCTENLEAALAKCEVEQSLRLALPSTLSKPSAQRGPFHIKVFDLLATALTEKSEEIGMKLQSAKIDAEGLQAREATLVEERGVAMQVLKEEASKFSAREEQWNREKEALDAASAATKSAKEAFASKEESHTDLASRLKDFEDINLESFTLMKAKVRKPTASNTQTEEQASEVQAEEQNKLATAPIEPSAAETAAAAGA